jgi:hypothetical protein
MCEINFGNFCYIKVSLFYAINQLRCSASQYESYYLAVAHSSADNCFLIGHRLYIYF